MVLDPTHDLLPEPPISGQAETIAAILAGSKRSGDAVPIRATFVQTGERGHRHPGPLADLVRARDEIALDLLLLVLASASAPPHDVGRPAEVWLRALGRSPTSKSAATALSRAWRRLETAQLITRQRQGRLQRIYLRREDASGEPYTYPSGRPPDLYFKLPFAYWADELDTKLSLRAKAMLLIALSLPDGFTLPYDRVPEWYGLSADTAQRGLKELEAAGLLDVTAGYKPAPLTAQGWTRERRYTLAARLRVPAQPPSRTTRPRRPATPPPNEHQPVAAGAK